MKVVNILVITLKLALINADAIILLITRFCLHHNQIVQLNLLLKLSLQSYQP